MTNTEILNLRFAKLNDALRKVTEDQCWNLLQEELKKRCRPSYVTRILGRYSILHCQRLRIETMRQIDRRKNHGHASQV